MSDEPTITATYRVPMSRLWDFRTWIAAYTDDLSAEQEGDEAKITARMPRRAARETECPEYAERV